jgi:hypothetical protein
MTADFQILFIFINHLLQFHSTLYSLPKGSVLEIWGIQAVKMYLVILIASGPDLFYAGENILSCSKMYLWNRSKWGALFLCSYRNPILQTKEERGFKPHSWLGLAFLKELIHLTHHSLLDNTAFLLHLTTLLYCTCITYIHNEKNKWH